MLLQFQNPGKHQVVSFVAGRMILIIYSDIKSFSIIFQSVKIFIERVDARVPQIFIEIFKPEKV